MADAIETAAPAGADNDAAFVDPIGEALVAIAEKVDELCAKVDAMEEHIGVSRSFLDSVGSLAQKRDREGRLSEFLGKYGADEGFKSVADAYKEAEGEDLFEKVFDLVSEARAAAGAHGEGGEAAPFDEAGKVGELFGQVKDHYGKRAAAFSKFAPRTEVEIEVSKEAPAPETKPEEKLAEPQEPNAIKQMRERFGKK